MNSESSQEEPKPYIVEDSDDEDDDQSPLTLGATRQMSRRLSNAEKEDAASSTLSSAASKSKDILTSLLWPGWLLNHLDFASFKIASRTWAHVWLCGLFICVPAALKWVGSGAYLAMILALIDPAGGQSIALGAINSVLLIYVATVAFTAQTIANAINWRIRGRISTQELGLAVFGSGECPTGDMRCFQAALLDGRYITTKTNIVTAFAVFITLMCMVWISNRKMLQTHMRLPLIMCIIYCTIAMTYTNHLPNFHPWTVGKVYFLPTFVGVAIRMALACVWFPTSSSANVTAHIARLHGTIARASMDLNTKIQETPLSSDEFPALADAFSSKYNPNPMFWAMLAPDLPLIALEPLYSRLDAEDIQEFLVAARRLAGCQSSFTFLYNEFLDLRKTVFEGGAGATSRRSSSYSSSEPLRKRRTTVADVSRKKGHWLRRRLKKEYLETGNFEAAFTKHMAETRVKFNSVDELQTVFEAVIKHHAPLIEASNKAALLASQWIDDANKFRATALLWPPYRKKRVQRQREFSQQIDEALANMDAEYRRLKQNCDWLHNQADWTTQFSESQTAYAIAQDVYCEYLSEQLMRISRRLCRWCVFVDLTRPHATLILPFQKQPETKRERIIKHFREQDISGGLEELSPPADPKSFRPVRNAQPRNPNSTPPRNWFHVAGTHLARLQKNLQGDSAIYTYKKASCTLIPMILYMDRNHLRWAYGYRVVWVSIMAALTCAPRAGDCAFNLAVRSSMSLFGCVFGLVCWYISAGRGDGNSYGFGGTLAVAAGILAYTRHFATLGGVPGRIVFSVTTVLVFGVSFVDEKGTSVTYLTHGWNVAWIRFVTVLVGLTVGFLVTILPHAETTKKAVRSQLAGLLHSLSETQTSIVNFALQRYDDDSVHQVYVKDAILEQLALKMRGISLAKMSMALLVFEPPLTGYWPAAHYNLLLRTIGELGYLQSSLYGLLNGVKDRDEILEVLTCMGMLDSDIQAGTYSLVYMCANSLVTGSPLPTITPGRLAPDHRLMVERHYQDGEKLEVLKAFSRTAPGRSKLVAVRISELYYRRLDALMAIVKRLVGEDFGVDSRMHQLFHHNEHVS